MKKKTIVYVIVNIVLAILTGLLSIKAPDDLLATISKYFSLTFAVLAFIILLVNIYRRLVKKDISKSLLIISTIIYVVFSIAYGVAVYYTIGGFILKMILMIMFYVSLIALILVYSSIFYFWIVKNNIKYIIRILVVLLTIVALCLAFILISKHTQVSNLLLITLNFVYVTSILILSSFLIIFIVNKLVLPNKKK